MRGLTRQNEEMQAREAEMEKIIQDLESERYELRVEVKEQLEKYLASNGLCTRLEAQVKENN